MDDTPPRSTPQDPAANAGADGLMLALGDAFRLPCVITRPTDGRVLYANAALRALLDMAAPYLIGECVDRIFFDEYKASALRAMWCRGDGPEQSPVRLRTENGSPLSASLIVGTVAMGVETLAVLILLPIAAEPSATGQSPNALDAVRHALPQHPETDPPGLSLAQLNGLLKQNP